MKRHVALILLLFAAACTGKEADRIPIGPADFALSLPVEPKPGAQVQRVELPASALVTLRRTDSGDVRIYDARGKPLTIARLAGDATRLNTVHLDAIPYNRQEGTTAGSSVSVRVAQSGQAVTVDTADGGMRSQERSVLFDTRRIQEQAVALTLDAVLPAQRPVTVSVMAGKDLKTWEPLAEQVLFRPGGGAALLGSGAIPLDGERLEGRYLLVSWNSPDNAEVNGANLQTSPSPPPPPISIPARGARLIDAHALQFDLPPAPGPAAIRLTMTGRDGVVPVSLLGRDARELPWTHLAMAVLRQGESGALLRPVGGMRQYKIEADARSAGFSEAPRLEFHYDPLTLLVAFNGEAPYKLAVGHAGAVPVFLNPSDLTTQPGPYPVARVGAGRETATIDLQAGEPDGPFDKRNLILWGTLLLGVAILALAAYRLMRSNAGANES
ncbi:MAG: DUF3999 family protein [Novosphingobium sp.]